MDGILVIDKPPRMTSHDVVAIVRRKLKMKRVGHAGTLDPLATGILIILVGKSTKRSIEFMKYDKGYESTLRLGLTTATADIDGKVIAQRPVENISEDDIRNTFSSFIGDIDQIPPMYSAVKQNGRKLYELARQGKVVEREPRRVRIDRLDIESIDLPDVKFICECSKGTYIRQLADDIGQKLGVGACITEIRRTKVGPYTIDDAVQLDDINENHLRYQRRPSRLF